MTNRVALVTGGSRGIGAAVCRRLATDGYEVVINYQTSAAEAQELISDLAAKGFRAEAIQADVTQIDEVRELVRRIRKTFGRLDTLVNNAGRPAEGLLLLTPSDDWWSIFLKNLSGTVNCSRVALPLLLASPSGHIINISSVAGIRGVRGLTAYGAAKAATNGFTRALAQELADTSVRINSVAPGPIDTRVYADIRAKQQGEARAPMGRLGNVDEVAEIVSMLASDRANFVNGQTIAVDGGITS